MEKLGKIPPASEITLEHWYLRRREFLRNALLFTATSTGVGGSLLWLMRGGRASERRPTNAVSASTHALTIASRDRYRLDEPMTPEDAVTSYNNFYEFGTDKS